MSRAIPSTLTTATPDAKMQTEELLSPQKNRFVLFPIHYPDIYKMYQTAQSAFWVTNEIDLEQDMVHWDTKLKDGEKQFLKMVLAFFASSDAIVLENLAERFSVEVQVPEARLFYAFQSAVESIHQETYSLLIDTYVKDDEEKKVLFDAVFTVQSIKKKADWCLNWISNTEAPFAQRLIAFALVEGLFFSSSFAAIFYFAERGLMPGLAMANAFISRDEGLHTEFAVLLYSKIRNRLSQEDVFHMVHEAVKHECEFVKESLPISLIGMNSDLMCQYVEYCADRLLVQLGYEKMYNTENPFAFMARLSIENKSNFFENRPSEYNKASVFSNENKFTVDEDF
jgi:ribonucleotide reductase beta subunit family protein with ferritin-like domain